MKETWRWFGPLDRITLAEIRQTGARGIVTSLHDIPYGEVWSRSAIAARKTEIETAGFTWDVVESLPVHEAIKRGAGDLDRLFDAYRVSMANLAAEGVTTICYNFMPLLDWTRTDLAAPVAGGGTCLRFSAPSMAAFELFMLHREEAVSEYHPAAIEAADIWFSNASESAQQELLRSIMSGLPGAYDRYDIRGLKTALAAYQGIGHAELRSNFKRFLDEVIPTAQDLGIKLAVHPDDPPRDILGLPRIVSTAADIDWVLSAVDSPSNGLTLCTGSLGAHPDNNVPTIAAKHAERIHFAHLRNTRREPDGSFEEAAHLDGDTDMVAVARALLDAKRSSGHSIPFRPDHGHALLDDLNKDAHPGYPLIGRLRGLAELRGLLHALSHG